MTGCCSPISTKHHQRFLSLAQHPGRHSQEHRPVDEVRGSARVGRPEQAQVGRLSLPDHPARGAQRVPRGPARRARQQGEDPDVHAPDAGEPAAAAATGTFQRGGAGRLQYYAEPDKSRIAAEGT